MAAVLRIAHAQDETNEAPGVMTPQVPRPAAALTPQAAPAAVGRSLNTATAPARPAQPASGAQAARRPGPLPGYAAESARTATRLSREERAARGFLREAAIFARIDLESSRLAVERASSPALRAYADDLLQYRTGADAEMLHLLHARGMAPPLMDNAQRKALNRLAKLSGPQFDRAFVQLAGPTGQRQEIALYEQALQATDDTALRTWIERQLPPLRAQQVTAAQFASQESRRARTGDVRPASLARAGHAPTAR